MADSLQKLAAEQAAFHQARQLRAFERARKSEAVKMIAAMESFKQLFGGSHPLKKLIRGVGMCTADAIPVIKQRFITQAMGW